MLISHISRKRTPNPKHAIPKLPGTAGPVIENTNVSEYVHGTFAVATEA
ncbi:hypothetical protein [Luteibacter sp. CQ10]